MLLLREKTRETLRRDLCRNCLEIESFARCGDGVSVDIRCEDLEFHITLGRGDLLTQQNGERVSLLARAAARDPDAQGLVGGMGAHQLGDRGLSKIVEDFGVTEKARDVDQQVLCQKLQFSRVRLQRCQIPSQVAR